MGRHVSSVVSTRFGKTILELGGNNAIIITPDADLEITIIGALFGAVGTCGQRCTSTRRLIIHQSVYDEVKNKYDVSCIRKLLMVLRCMRQKILLV